MTETTITLRILEAYVLLRMGTDLVTLQVDKPSPFPPEVDPDPLRMSFEVRANHGVAYCKEHFGVEPRIINTRGR